MRVIKPSFKIHSFDVKRTLRVIERAGRTAYQSELSNDPEAFIASIIDRGHDSVLEHGSITVRIICDRGVSHEIVRHRIAAFTQESTRYCNYSKEKFGKQLTFISPCFWDTAHPSRMILWENAMRQAEATYMKLLENGATPQEARSVLPNSLKTTIVVTANIREWRHILTLRTSPKAHPQMREVMYGILERFKIMAPVLFADIL